MKLQKNEAHMQMNMDDLKNFNTKLDGLTEKHGKLILANKEGCQNAQYDIDLLKES